MCVYIFSMLCFGFAYSAWLTEAEKEGKSPLADPLAIIGIFSIFIPFIILGVAFATGLIELP